MLKLIQIDDAGSGSLIGGTCIGIYDTKKDNYYCEIIPIELYNSENYNKKFYLDYVIEIVKRAFEAFKINNLTRIEVCQGYMFEKLRKWLDDNGYKWENTKITGILQEKVESSFENYAISLGFPYQYIKYTKYPFHFHRILKWVYADYENRSKLCKTGWKSWQKYGNLPLDITIDYINDDNEYHCLKCGKKLNPNRKVKIIKYTSNLPNVIYVHQNCQISISK